MDGRGEASGLQLSLPGSRADIITDSNTHPTEFCYDLRILLNTGSQKLLLGDRICHGVNYLAHFVLDQLFSSLVAVRRNLRFYQALRRYLAYCLAQSGYLRFLFFFTRVREDIHDLLLLGLQLNKYLNKTLLSVLVSS